MRHFEVSATASVSGTKKPFKHKYTVTAENFVAAYNAASKYTQGRYAEHASVTIEAMNPKPYVSVITDSETYGIFYKIKAVLVNAEGDEYRELHLVQALDDIDAKVRLKESIGEFDVAGIELTDIEASF